MQNGYGGLIQCYNNVKILRHCTLKRFLLHLKRPKYFDIYKPKQSQYYDQNKLIDKIINFNKEGKREEFFGNGEAYKVIVNEILKCLN